MSLAIYLATATKITRSKYKIHLFELTKPSRYSYPGGYCFFSQYHTLNHKSQNANHKFHYLCCPHDTSRKNCCHPWYKRIPDTHPCSRKFHMAEERTGTDGRNA